MDESFRLAFDSALPILMSYIEKCHSKYGNDAGGDMVTNRIYILHDIIREYERNHSLIISDGELSILIFNLGKVSGICKRYLDDGKLEKEDLLTLNNIYRKYIK